MTQGEFTFLLRALALSQMGASRLFRVAPRSVRRWCAGEAPVPMPIAILLRLWVDGRIGFYDIDKAASPPSPDDVDRLLKRFGERAP
jgi:hypothetical protein